MRATILLIGGGSSVGKTTAARRLAHDEGYIHVNLRELYRLWGDPRLELVRDEGDWALPTERLCARLAERARRLEPHVVEWVAARAAGGVRYVLEGEGLEPSIAARLAPGLAVRAAFVVERDGARLRATLERRSSSFRKLSAHEQGAVVALDECYNRRIFEGAITEQQPWLASQPWGTLAARLRALLTLP